MILKRRIFEGCARFSSIRFQGSPEFEVESRDLSIFCFVQHRYVRFTTPTPKDFHPVMLSGPQKEFKNLKAEFSKSCNLCVGQT